MKTELENIVTYNGTALIETIKESAGKFELPDSANKKPFKGKLIKISPQDDITEWGQIYKCPAKIGQTIWYRNWSSEVVDIGGKDYIFVKFRDIIAGEE